MAEKNTTVASSVESDGTVTSVNQPEVVDIIGGAEDTVQSTEEKIQTGELSKYLLAGTITSTEGAKSTTEKSNAPAEETITSTKKTSSPTEETIPAAETIPCLKETSPPTEKATASAQGISYPTEEIIPRTEEACLPPEVATPPVQKTGSSAETTMPFTVQTSLPTEQTVALAEKIIISTEKTNQPTEEMVSPTEDAILSAGGTVIPTVKTIQDGNPESELVTSCPLIENSPLENTAHGERSDSVPAVEEVIPLPTEEAYKENGEAAGNVKEDHDADDNGDDAEADEEICSEEFQQGNDSSESPSTSPIFSSQPESPTNNDSAEEQQGASRRPDITKHSYSRYNTVSYRKIRKGNTKQRIDEFESMLHIN